MVIEVDDLLKVLERAESRSKSIDKNHIKEYAYGEWALQEIIKIALDHPGTPLLEVIEDFAFKMRVYFAGVKNEAGEEIFRIAAETAEAFCSPNIFDPS